MLSNSCKCNASTKYCQKAVTDLGNECAGGHNDSHGLNVVLSMAP
jgi:hypothetical protein